MLYAEDFERLGWKSMVLNPKCFLSQAIAAVQEYLQIFSFIRAVSDRKANVSGWKTGALLQVTAEAANMSDGVSTSPLPSGYRREGFSWKLGTPELKTSNFYRSKSSCTWLQWKHYLYLSGGKFLLRVASKHFETDNSGSKIKTRITQSKFRI